MTSLNAADYRRIGLVLLIVIIAYAAFGLLARPAADDFCEMIAARDYGAVGSAVLFYNNWSGRFALFFLTGTLFSTLGSLVAPIFPATTLGAMLILWSWALRSVTPKPFFIVLVCLCSFLVGTPNIYQSLYFTSGNIVYLPPIALGGLLFGSLLRRWNPILIGMIAVASAGFNEPQALFQGLLLFIYFWKTRSYGSIFALTGTAVSIVLELVAPGNAIRSSFLPGASSLPSAALLTVQFTITYIGQTLLARPLALAIPLAAGLVLARSRRYPRQLRLCLIIICMAFVLNLVLLFPVAYGSGENYPRVFTLPHLVWAVSFIALGMIAGSGKSLGKELLYASTIMTLFFSTGWFINNIGDMAKFAFLTDHGRSPSDLAIKAEFSENNFGYVRDCRQYLWKSPYTEVPLYPKRWPGFNAETLKFAPAKPTPTPKSGGA